MTQPIDMHDEGGDVAVATTTPTHIEELDKDGEYKYNIANN